MTCPIHFIGKCAGGAVYLNIQCHMMYLSNINIILINNLFYIDLSLDITIYCTLYCWQNKILVHVNFGIQSIAVHFSHLKYLKVTPEF